MTTRPDLSSLIKSYDVRGVVGKDLTPDIARAIGAAFADAVVLPDGDAQVVVGWDMRESSPELVTALGDGLRDRGIHVIEIGLSSTDGLYHASGVFELPGVMVTASHNPAEYNGMKLCRARAQAIGAGSGLNEVRDLAAGYVEHGIPLAELRGQRTERDTLADYAKFLRSLVDLREIRPLKVVVDAGNAMAGHTVPAVLGTAAGLPELPLEIIPLFFELDGTFPNHEANPLDPATLVDLQAAVREHGADIGLAFDGDADRCFAIDQTGAVVPASAITALVGLRETATEIAAGRTPTVIHNLISSRAVPQMLAEAGATPVRSRVGHSFIKAKMAKLDAVFGGEHSAHFYFRDFFFADSGLLAAMHMLAALGSQDSPLSQLLSDYTPYAASGEINSQVDNADAAIARVQAAFADQEPQVDDLDGITLSHWDDEPQWWLNVRASNTEPLLRLNCEAATHAQMEYVRDTALQAIRTSAQAGESCAEPASVSALSNPKEA